MIIFDCRMAGVALSISAHNAKKIRDDNGYWEQVEVYVKRHPQAGFSHSLCPECAKKHSPDINIYDE